MPATLRSRFGVSWFRAGQPDFPWCEARALVLAALADTSTSLGAAFQGWKYPASMEFVHLLMGVCGEAAKPLLPFNLDAPAEGTQVQVSEEEVEQATADLWGELLFEE